jgi:hypothetical protein
VTDLQDVLKTCVDDGAAPGAVGPVARGDQIEVAALGSACTVPKLGAGLAKQRVFGWSGCSVVLVDDAAEDTFAPYGRVEVDHGRRIMDGWKLISDLMWTVLIEMPLILAQHSPGVAPL